MFKKIIGVLLITTIVLASSLAAYAGNADEAGSLPGAGIQIQTDVNDQTQSGADGQTQTDKSLKDAEKEKILEENQNLLSELIADSGADETKQSIVKITKPDADKDSTYKKSYVLSGITDQTDVKVYLAKYNEVSKKYEAFANTDGESSWDIGSFGAFAKEVALTKGTNKLKIVAYRTSQEGKLNTEDIQINYFTVSLLDESIKDKIIKGILDLTKSIFTIKKQ